MLGKLLKYDLKKILKFLSVFYIITLFFSIMTRLFINTESPFILFLIGRILSGTLISFFVSTLINELMGLWIKSFARGIYGDESYLTHTLPAKKTEIYFSKFFASVIVSVFSVAVIVVTALIAYYSNDRWQFVKQFLSVGNTAKITLLLAVIAFLELINLIQCGFTGIILGHKMNGAKAGLSVLFSFLVYTASQGIVLLFAALATLVNGDFKALFTAQNAQISESVLILTALAYLIIIVADAIINVKLLGSGVDVE